MPRLLLGCLLLLVASPAFAQISPGKLSEAHAELEGVRNCSQCHKGGSDSLDAQCLDCHTAVAWLREQDRGLHAREGRENCADCHPEHAGRDFELVEWEKGEPASFDHARAGWALQGAHARAECASCHRADKQVKALTLRMQSKNPAQSFLGLDTSCRNCHTDPHDGRLGPECANCHGQENWKTTKEFDHARTGYALRGKHATLECAACHRNGKFGTTQNAKTNQHLRPIAHAECSSCHKDPHAGRFGAKCSRCHVEDDFHRVSGDRFDHDRTRYPLRGRHTQVKCDRCHEPAQGGWGPKPAFARCTDCHDDAHAGTATLAGAVVDCDRCHDVGGFRPSRFTVAMHGESSFALEGKHAAVDCAKCHAKREDVARFGAARVDLRPAHARCLDCHQTAHGEQLAARDDRGECAPCHDVNGFAPSTFGLAAHAKAGFPLEGAHARSKCQACHGVERPGLPSLAPEPLGKAAFAFFLDEERCGDCHADPHLGRYLPSGDGPVREDCGYCHGATRFKPSKVDVAMHDRFPFRLEGEHRATPCLFCHLELGEPLRERRTLVLDHDPTWVVDLTKAPTACEACHTEGVPR